jgi:hypothetical protein
MSQNLIVEIRGLSTNNNQISKVSPGSLSIAKNIVLDKDGVADPRRGLNYLANPPAGTTRNDRLFEYQDTLIAHRSNDDSLAYYDDGIGWTNYSGTYAHPDEDYARMRSLQAAGNCYFTTSTGIMVLDSIAGPVYSTGMPKGLDGVASTTGASGFMTNNTQVAYRIVWGTKDANNNLYLGSPSQRIIAANTSGGTRDVSITFTIPSGITVDDFFQVYRSKESASSTDEPNDELQLVYEANPTAGEITAKSVTFTDSASTSLMGASLYTNSSQEGISEANDIPPVAKDIALFKGYTFFASVRTKHKLYISLLAVSGTGLVVNDTITIDGDVYTAKAAENIASAEFKVSTAGSAAQNIEDTAKSLVKVINQYTSNTGIYAYYESGYQDLPGQILLEKRVIDEVSFSVTVSRAVAWDIDDGESDNEVFINGLMWGKNQQPEHVPSSHLEFVGSKNFEIRRILALRDSLFILKDDGVFRLTGSGGSWSIDPLDTSTKIIAPDSAVVVNNQIFCLSDQGIVAISDIGVEIKSRPIENQLTDLSSVNYTNLKTKSFGVGYETDRKYLLFTINSVDDTYANQAFVYNTITDRWASWEKPCTHGFVRPSVDKLYLSRGDNEHVLEERKSFTYLDYADEELTGYNILSFSTTDIVIDSLTDIEVGDVLYQSETQFAIIEEIDVNTNTLTVHTEIDWDIAACSIIKGIECEIEFTNLTNDNAGVMKHFQEMAWLFRERSFNSATVSFYTDLSAGYEDLTINGSFGSGSWGAFPWGMVPWGGVQRPKPTRLHIPREKSRGSLLSIKFKCRNAFAQWSINGFSLQFEFVSERMVRD